MSEIKKTRLQEIEQSIIDFLNGNRTEENQLVLDTYQYQFFDAESKNDIVEIKNRGKHYTTKIAEIEKLNNLRVESKIRNKNAFYVVRDEKGVWSINISEYGSKIRNLETFKRPLPRNSEFGDNELIPKKVKEIPEEMFNNES